MLRRGLYIHSPGSYTMYLFKQHWLPKSIILVFFKTGFFWSSGCPVHSIVDQLASNRSLCLYLLSMPGPDWFL